MDDTKDTKDIKENGRGCVRSLCGRTDDTRWVQCVVERLFEVKPPP